MHADAEGVRIDVVEGDGDLAIAVADDGRGFDPAVRTGGFGLLGMRERVKLAGGSMETKTAPCEGTRVRATLAARHRVAATAGLRVALILPSSPR
jgi:signal transduction histidine kinase